MGSVESWSCAEVRFQQHFRGSHGNALLALGPPLQDPDQLPYTVRLSQARHHPFHGRELYLHFYLKPVCYAFECNMVLRCICIYFQFLFLFFFFLLIHGPISKNVRLLLSVSFYGGALDAYFQLGYVMKGQPSTIDGLIHVSVSLLLHLKLAAISLRRVFLLFSCVDGFSLKSCLHEHTVMRVLLLRDPLMPWHRWSLLGAARLSG